jgi:hypothetical protein
MFPRPDKKVQPKRYALLKKVQRRTVQYYHFFQKVARYSNLGWSKCDGGNLRILLCWPKEVEQLVR